jgi:hypothetical protein
MKKPRLKKEQVEFVVIVSPETDSIEKHLSFGETGVDYSEFIQRVKDDGGANVWLWCTVEVRATFKGLTASDYLSCCSYESEEAFRQDPYFGDMKDQAFEELSVKVLDIVNALQP